MESEVKMVERGETTTILIPCLNEETTIPGVVSRFRDALPMARIIVIDNGSNDETASVAAIAGAQVLIEKRKGKGNAVAAGLNFVKSPFVILVDGDATYDESLAPKIIKELSQGADMVVTNRNQASEQAFRAGHKVGNFLLSRVQQKLLKVKVTDTLSGYRGFTKQFLTTFIPISGGFELEANLNIHSAVIGANVINIDSNYASRPIHSKSKLNTYSDGAKILRVILKLLITWRPLLVFSIVGITGFLLSACFVLIPVSEYLETGIVLHIPTLIVSSILGVFSLTIIFFGLIANQIVSLRIENSRRDFKILNG